MAAFTRRWADHNRRSAERLDARYARLGERYWGTVVAADITALMVLWWSGLAIACIAMSASLWEYAAAGAFTSLCIVSMVIWISWAEQRGPGKPIWDWHRAGRTAEGAAAAWRASVDLPFLSVARMAPWRAVLFVCVPLGLFVKFVLGDSWLQGAAAAGAMTAVLPCALVVCYFTSEWAIGPIRREAARKAEPVLGVVHPTSSLRWRVLVALTAMGAGTAVLAALLSTHGPVTATMVFVDVPVAVVGAAIGAFGMSFLFTEMVVSRLDEFTAATHAIRDGDLSARVAVLSDDELGALASSFNAMTADLQSARGRLVLAREEERRRVRRDLHDGLGPSLAALVMQLELADDLLDRDPAAARRVIGGLKRQTQDAIADIRRLVYELRPPSLDELGLVGAIRENASRLTAGEGARAGPRMTIQAPPELPHLPAAVEVAAFRIAQEAMTNVVRHAHARTCTIDLELNGALDLVVSDDGSGIPDGRPTGVGLASMRERAAELGGSCEVVSGPGGGTVVRARLPATVA